MDRYTCVSERSIARSCTGRTLNATQLTQRIFLQHRHNAHCGQYHESIDNSPCERRPAKAAKTATHSGKRSRESVDRVSTAMTHMRAHTHAHAHAHALALADVRADAGAGADRRRRRRRGRQSARGGRGSCPRAATCGGELSEAPATSPDPSRRPVRPSGPSLRSRLEPGEGGGRSSGSHGGPGLRRSPCLSARPRLPSHSLFSPSHSVSLSLSLSLSLDQLSECTTN